MLTLFLFFLEGFGQLLLVFCDDVDVFCQCLLGVLLLFGVFLMNGQVTIWSVFVLCFGRFLFWCNTFYRQYRPLISVIANVTYLFGVIAIFDERRVNNHILCQRHYGVRA